MQDKECDGHEGGGASHNEAQGDEGHRVASQDSVQKGVACFRMTCKQTASERGRGNKYCKSLL